MGTADDGLASFQIRPSFEQKFRPSKVKDIIHNILVEELGGKTYKEVLPRKEAIIEQVLKQVKALYSTKTKEGYSWSFSILARCYGSPCRIAPSCQGRLPSSVDVERVFSVEDAKSFLTPAVTKSDEVVFLPSSLSSFPLEGKDVTEAVAY
ncbi:unnamed protein product [Cyprideis torosa]|uniref:Uncharacterized protein n=1 Tax=Cyprideis torosa TaxID=163714 RepID=A0A7R8ZN69_9CRUS|nr:unnamed protein product [Cyprideis torosa]CAG0897280.1 unnamed protein product [Cyprideis torosa]